MWRDLLRELLITLGLISRPDFIMRIMDRHPTPDEIPPGVLVVVGNGDQQKWACFQCPAGCGNRFQLSLNPSKRPRWEVASDWLNRPNISPSVRQTNACRAHFWVKNGSVEWCRDSGHRNVYL